MTDDICIRGKIDSWMDCNTYRVPHEDIVWEMVTEECSEHELYTDDDGEWLTGFPENLLHDDMAFKAFVDAMNYAKSVVEEINSERGWWIG